MDDQTTAPDAPPTGARTEQGDALSEQTAPKPSADGSGRFAVYDVRYLRFVGGTHDKKPSKADAKKIAGHDDFEIREV